MAAQKADHMDKAVRAKMMEMLKDRVNDPTKLYIRRHGMSQIEAVAGDILADAGLIASNGRITLAGMDYYRREAHPARTWLRSNWFPVFVSVFTAAATITAGVITVLFGNRPC